jgi:hypothetical protein
MAGFNKVESPEEFKLRLNSLTEKLNKIKKNVDTQSVGGAADSQRIRFRES